MKTTHFLLPLLAGFILSGCAGNADVKPSSPESQAIATNATDTPNKTPTDDGIIHVINVKQLTDVTSNKSMISSAGLNQCHLQSKFPTLFTEAASDSNIQVNLVNKLNTKAKGYNLETEYTQIIDRGNPFIGHYKFTSLHVILYKDGKKIAAADFGRNSGGGFFGGFKGSCSVLGRTVQANARDIVKWLQAPVDGARMGNL